MSMTKQGKTIVEKIMSSHSGVNAYAGDIVTAAVDLMFCHDGNRPLGAQVFDSYGVEKVCDSKRVIQVIDHAPSCPTESVARMHAYMHAFAQRQGTLIYERGDGSCHQIIPEQGHVKPGQIIIATDSHTCTLGALNAFASGVGVSDLASAMITGQLWFLVPETIKVVLNGALPSGVYAKDVILYLAGLIGANGANYQSIEFTGPGIDRLGVGQRMTITNMVIELGAKCGIMPFDEKLRQWLCGRVDGDYQPVFADADAAYCRTIEITLNGLTPQIAKPHQVDHVTPVAGAKGTPIQHAIIGTCTNGRMEDLEIAAAILRGKKIKKGVSLIVAPASRSIYLEAMEQGLLRVFIEAGAVIAIPGCSACSGGSYVGVPGDGEAVITTANRNFKGRLGNPNAFIYLASPATVAASALTGRIEDCREFM